MESNSSRRMSTVSNSSAANTPTVEVKLLKDDNWKRIQQNTFTRWVNQHLKNASGSPHIDNLATDFHDGILLIRLAEILSHRSIPRYNRKPTMRTQKLDNISTVLNFLQNEEGIKIVNIDALHIADHNLKLILGLIWTLILHYSISQPIPTTPKETPSDEGTGASVRREEIEPLPSPRKKVTEPTPKQRLLAWIQSKLSHSQQSVNNFTSDWNDGITLGALVDACLGAGCFPEWRYWDSNDPVGNTNRAMQAAEDGLGVEKLITPEELTNPNVDEKSVMTYLAQFPRAQPLPLGSIMGLERHPLCGVPSTFRVQLQRKSLRPSVDVIDPRGSQLDNINVVRSTADDGGGEEDAGNKPIYEVTFIPTLIGEHKINVFAKNANEASSSPRLPVEQAVVGALPAPEVVGLGTEAIQGERRRFRIDSVNDHNRLDVLVVDPEGREIILDAGSERVEHSVTCCYTPSTLGEHTLSVLYNKRHIPGSPYALRVRPNENRVIEQQLMTHNIDLIDNTQQQEAISADGLNLAEQTMPQNLARHAFAEGPGLKEGYVDQLNTFSVRSSTSADHFDLYIDGPQKPQINIRDDPEVDGLAHVDYIVQKPGDYQISMLIDDVHINGSPFRVIVHPFGESTPSEASHFAEGPYEEQMTTVISRTKISVTETHIVEDNVELESVVEKSNFIFAQQRQRELEYMPLNVDETVGTAVSKVTTEAAKQMDDDKQQQNCTKEIESGLLGEGGDARLVRIGAGEEGLVQFTPGRPAQFSIDTSQTDLNTLFIGVVTPLGPTEEVNVRHIGNGKYDVSYTVPYASDALVIVKYGCNDVPGSPFKVRPKVIGNGSIPGQHNSRSNNYYRQ